MVLSHFGCKHVVTEVETCAS